MATVRNLITNAARTAGIIGVVEDLNSNEAVQALTELNNLMEHLQLQSYYPQNNVTNSVTGVASSFTIGRDEINTNGEYTDYLTAGTISGLREAITTSGAPASVYFDTPTITLANGDTYYCDGSLRLYNGAVDNVDSVRTDSVGAGVSFTGPTIPISTVLNITTCQFVVTGTFYKIGDVYADRPNRVIALTQQEGSNTRPLTFIPEDNWDSAYKTNASISHPRYFTTRGTFPFMTVEVYPAASGATFNVITQIVQGDFELNDEIELPMGYKPLIQYKLAIILAEDYGYNAKAGLLGTRAKKMEGDLKKLNNQGTLMSNSGSPGRGENYNFNSDTFGGF